MLCFVQLFIVARHRLHITELSQFPLIVSPRLLRDKNTFHGLCLTPLTDHEAQQHVPRGAPGTRYAAADSAEV